MFGSESASTVTAFKNQTGVSFPLLLDDETYRSYANPDGAISPYPVDVIVDKRGKIRYLRHEFDGDAMKAMVQKLLNED